VFGELQDELLPHHAGCAKDSNVHPPNRDAARCHKSLPENKNAGLLWWPALWLTSFG
jgi:hypothetical protein